METIEMDFEAAYEAYQRDMYRRRAAMIAEGVPSAEFLPRIAGPAEWQIDLLILVRGLRIDPSAGTLYDRYKMAGGQHRRPAYAHFCALRDSAALLFGEGW